MKLIPREGGGWMVMTNLANRSADHVVVAMGAWSRQLLDPLGIKVALETERGYHAMLFEPEVMPALPISNKTRAFGVTPMEDGLRVAGTVEIAGLDAPPNEERAKVLVQHARRMFPALTGRRCATGWVSAVHAGQSADPGSRRRAGPACISFSGTDISA